MLKSYKDNQTGEIINVVDVYENIAITDKKERIDARRLNDPRFYSEHIDPKNFFNSESTYNTFVDKINAIDLSNIPDDSSVSDSGVSIKMEGIDPNFIPPSTESAVVQYDPEEEKRELMQKYGVKDNSELERQNHAFSKILQDPQESNNQNKVQNQTVQTVQQPVQQPVESIQHPIQPTQQVEDPIITMFKNVKRKEDFSIDIKVEDKIPRLDFIEMMEDSYEISIIEFLADELTKKLFEDPNLIKQKIIDEIKERVYPKPVKATPKKTTTKKRTTTKSSKPKVEELEKKDPPKPPKDRKIVEGETPEKPKSMK